MTKEKIVFSIKTSLEYGMFWYWHLIKAVVNEDGTYRYLDMWFLGQDVKVCSRMLGMEPKEIMSEIGIEDLKSEENKIKLASFIMNRLDITEESLENVQSWELACE